MERGNEIDLIGAKAAATAAIWLYARRVIEEVWFIHWTLYDFLYKVYHVWKGD